MGYYLNRSLPIEAWSWDWAIQRFGTSKIASKASSINCHELSMNDSIWDWKDSITPGKPKALRKSSGLDPLQSHSVAACWRPFRMIVRMSHSKAIFISKWKGLLVLIIEKFIRGWLNWDDSSYQAQIKHALWGGNLWPGNFVLSFSSNRLLWIQVKPKSCQWSRLNKWREMLDSSQTKRKNYAIHIYELLRKVHQVGCVENDWKISAHNISMWMTTSWDLTFVIPKTAVKHFIWYGKMSIID